MNAYIADRIARQHTDALLADAAAARRVRRARKGSKRRVVTAHPAADSAAEAASAPTAPRPGAAVAHAIAWPFTAARSWLAAGYL
jgi:hypothetical protein